MSVSWWLSYALSHVLSHSLSLSHTLSHPLTLSHTLSHSRTVSHLHTRHQSYEELCHFVETVHEGGCNTFT